MSAWVWIAVAFLGGLGALARVLVSSLIAARLPRLFPTGTLAVNATGTFLLGLLTGLSAGGAQRKRRHRGRGHRARDRRAVLSGSPYCMRAVSRGT
jgi:fluoride ion exporter CrcB/FEX